jgi:hypothetical protein
MKSSQGLNINFDKLQAWRDLSDRVMPLGALFEATLRTMDALYYIGKEGTPAPGRDNFFVTQRSLLLGIRSSAEVLQNRIKGVIDLVRIRTPCLACLTLALTLTPIASSPTPLTSRTRTSPQN